MMAPVAAKLFIAQAALPVLLLLLLHGSVLPTEDFQGLAKILTCHVNTAEILLPVQSNAVYFIVTPR